MSNIIDQLLKMDLNEIEVPKGVHKMYCKKLGKELEFEIEAIDAEKVAEIQEMSIDITKGEIKVGILNNLLTNGVNIDTKEIEAIIDKYAGDDGTFTHKEYMALKEDPVYKDILNQYGVTPWFK